MIVASIVTLSLGFVIGNIYVEYTWDEEKELSKMNNDDV
jgi:hypothetical protein